MLLVVFFFAITTFTPGDFFCAVISCGEIETNHRLLSASTVFSPFGEKPKIANY